MTDEIKADYVADARGSACPGPLLEAKKSMSKIKVGQIVEVRSNDPGTKRDLPIWVKKAGHEIIGIKEGTGFFSIFIRRKK
ncbi:MAG: sulfurtransferase TusA family protein [Candidatus Thorarchaeota archaeon]|nr:sulfurtransferase TusA family protein [Candidatus Thorarchaeota archaeon]